jgi:hypothetical protein
VVVLEISIATVKRAYVIVVVVAVAVVVFVKTIVVEGE